MFQPFSLAMMFYCKIQPAPARLSTCKCMQQQLQRLADLNDTDDIRATRSRVQLPWRPSSPFQRLDGVRPRSGTNAAKIEPLLPALHADHSIEVSCHRCIEVNESCDPIQSPKELCANHPSTTFDARSPSYQRQRLILACSGRSCEPEPRCSGKKRCCDRGDGWRWYEHHQKLMNLVNWCKLI